MIIVYICAVLIFMLSFTANMIATWKHPYFNIGKEESGKNGVLIRNMLVIANIAVFMLCAINVGRYVDSNGFLYITLGFLLGVLLGNGFARRILNKKYKDVVYEKYSVKKAREAEVSAATEREADSAEYEEENPIESVAYDETGQILEAGSSFPQERRPHPPDHSKAHPWE